MHHQFSLKAFFFCITVVSLWFLAPLAYWSAYGRFFLVGELLGTAVAVIVGAIVIMIRRAWIAANERSRDAGDR